MSDSSDRGPLGALGIDESSERVYRFILRNPGCTLLHLCDRLGVPTETARLDLAPLVERRLVRRTAGDAFSADVPEVALGRLLSREARRLSGLEEALSTAEAQIQVYAAEHLVGQRPDRQPVSVDHIALADFADLMVTLVESGSGELLFLRPDQWYLPTGKRMDVAVTKAMAAGRRSRVIYPAQILETSSDSVRGRIRAGERVKVVPRVATRMAVFGSEAAILPKQWGENSGARLLIREPAIVACCIAYFDELWSHAVMVSVWHEDADGGPQQALIEMLASGAKDEQIARALGVSLRTVRRRVAFLLADLGVDSRFQAGMESVRRGWL